MAWLLLTALLAGCSTPPPPRPPALSVAVVGDMPYNAAEERQFDTLIDQVNADAQVSVVIHLGDIKSGAERCDDALLRSRLAQIRRFASPVVFTPGDNEWTDCHRDSNGRYLPTERLAFLRLSFFPDPHRSLGAQPLALTPQSATPGFETFVENALFVRARVVFSTVHVVGSGNGLLPWTGVDAEDSDQRPRADRLAEVRAREAAALAWIDRIFDEAARIDAAGVLLAWQANPEFERSPAHPLRAGFNAILARLAERARAFGRPVLLVQGDHHELIVDRPWARAGSHGESVPRFQRVQGYGSPHIHWVKVQVDPDAPEVFAVVPMKVRETP
ncbi:MAG: metallophosphoesterase [Rubrivivax sp.]|jgi:hypothetical protein